MDEQRKENERQKRREDQIVNQMLKAREEMTANSVNAVAEGEKSRRIESLCALYEAFDVNGDGTVSHKEMFALGQTRRALGQKEGEWTHAMNNKMMLKMGCDQYGHVSMRRCLQTTSFNLPHLRNT